MASEKNKKRAPGSEKSREELAAFREVKAATSKMSQGELLLDNGRLFPMVPGALAGGWRQVLQWEVDDLMAKEWSRIMARVEKKLRKNAGL